MQLADFVLVYIILVYFIPVYFILPENHLYEIPRHGFPYTPPLHDVPLYKITNFGIPTNSEFNSKVRFRSPFARCSV